MRRMLAAIGLGLLIISAQAETTEETILRIFGERTLFDGLRHITPQNREAVVAFLRDVAKGRIERIGTTTPLSYTGASILLMRLGDKEGMELVAERYRKAQGTQSIATILRDIEAARQPAMINYLGPDFLREDGERATVKNHGDLIAWRHDPQSIMSIMLTLHIIEHNDRFSPEMKAWADAMLKNKYRSRKAFKETARLWWRENEARFAAGQFEAVEPVPLTAFEQATVSTPVPESPDPHPPPTAMPVPSPAAPPPVASTAVVPTAQPSTLSLGWLWTGAALSVALLAGLLLFWKRRV